MARHRTSRSLESYLRQAAEIVDRHGDAYLPIFERLEREVAAEAKVSAARDRARALARGNSKPRGTAPAA